MSDEKGPKTKAFHEHVAPILERLLAVAEDHGINLFMLMILDETTNGAAATHVVAKTNHDLSDTYGHHTIAGCWRWVCEDDLLVPKVIAELGLEAHKKAMIEEAKLRNSLRVHPFLGNN